MPKKTTLLVKDIPPEYKLTKQEYKLIDKYIETLDYIESFDYAGYIVPSNIEDIQAYKKRFVERTLRRESVAHVLKINSTSLMRENTANAEEILYFFSEVMRGRVKDQFGLDAPLSERLKAAVELAKRTVDLANKTASDTDIHISIDWKRA